MNVGSYTHSVNPQWRYHDRGNDNCRGDILAQGNGTTDYGEVLGGTVLARDAAGKLVPCGNQAITAQAASTNTPQMHDSRNFYVSDTVGVVSKLGVKDSVTLAAGDNPSDLDIEAAVAGDSRIKVALIDPSANSQILRFEVDDDGTDRIINIYLATDGGGSITTTVTQLMDYINGSLSHELSASNPETGADLCQAVSATALTGGVAVGGKVATGRSVTSVDKTSTPNTVTFDGAAVAVEVGDELVNEAGGDAASRPVGVLNQTCGTFRYEGTTKVASDQQVALALEGDARKSKLVGHHDAMDERLKGAPWTDYAGTTHVTPFEGFVIRSV